MLISFPVQPTHTDWCGGTIFMDLQSGKELTYKSTQFPASRSTPYACSWDVKVGIITNPYPFT